MATILNSTAIAVLSIALVLMGLSIRNLEMKVSCLEYGFVYTGQIADDGYCREKN